VLADLNAVYRATDTKSPLIVWLFKMVKSKKTFTAADVEAAIKQADRPRKATEAIQIWLRHSDIEVVS
jgi:hypothetical protein